MGACGIVVVGAGPAGLGVAACLRARGVEAVILEGREEVGSSWRRHYARLHLHTTKHYSALPGMAWPAHVPTYPSRQDVTEYLEAYAERFDLRPRFGEEITGIRSEAGEGDPRWTLVHTSGTSQTSALVVCTGINRQPRRPSWPGMEGFTGEMIHAAEYRDGRAYRGRRALVVGAGNSGAEIALDLWEHGAKVSLCVRGPLHVVPRDVLGVPAQVASLRLMRHLPPRLADRLSLMMSRAQVGDLSPYGIRRPRLGPVSQVMRTGRVPLIDIGTVALIRQGKVRVVGGIDRFAGERAHTVDGEDLEVDLVVLATGYRSGLGELFGEQERARLLDGRELPRSFGAAAAAPGLYFVGFRNPITGQLHDIARESERVAATIATARA